MNFSVTTGVTVQTRTPHFMLSLGVMVGVPVLSDTAMVTSVPAQTGMRWAVSLRLPGSTMFPEMTMVIFGLLLGLWPFPIVVIF